LESFHKLFARLKKASGLSAFFVRKETTFDLKKSDNFSGTSRGVRRFHFSVFRSYAPESGPAFFRLRASQYPEIPVDNCEFSTFSTDLFTGVLHSAFSNFLFSSD